MYWSILIACFLCLFVNISKTRLVIHDTAANGTYVAVTLKYQDNPATFDPITTYMVADNKTFNRSLLNITGNVVIFKGEEELVEEDAKYYQERGAIGLVIGYGDRYVNPGSLRLFNEGAQPMKGIKLPIISLPRPIGNEIIRKLPEGILANVTISGDINPWDVALGTPFFIISIIVALWSCVNTAIAGIKYWGFLKIHGFYSISCFSLFLEGISSAIRFWYFATDPLDYHRTFSATYHFIFYTISVPFLLASTVLVTLYWHESMKSSSLEINVFIRTKAFRAVAYILMFLIFAFEIIRIGFFASRTVNQRIPQYIQGAYAVLSGIFAIFYLVTTIRVLLVIKGHSSGKRSMFRTTVKLLITGVAHVLITLALLLPAWDEILYRATSFIASFTFLMIACNIKSLSSIMAFSVPKRSGVSSGSSKKKTPEVTEKTKQDTGRTNSKSNSNKGASLPEVVIDEDEKEEESEDDSDNDDEDEEITSSKNQEQEESVETTDIKDSGEGGEEEEDEEDEESGKDNV